MADHLINVAVLSKICSCCKVEKSANEFHRAASTKTGLVSTCKFCTAIKAKKWRNNNLEKDKLSKKIWKENNKEKNREINRTYANCTPRGRFIQCKKSARRSGKVWNLTFEQFCQFWQKPCSYCGDAIETIGLDRIDSNLGYEVKNIVACCTFCNFMKRKYTKTEFLNQCFKIVNHSIKKGELE